LEKARNRKGVETAKNRVPSLRKESKLKWNKAGWRRRETRECQGNPPAPSGLIKGASAISRRGFGLQETIEQGQVSWEGSSRAGDPLSGKYQVQWHPSR
jgi:hypothetical protein